VLSLSVQGRRAGLLSQIEQDVLDDGKPIGSALRRCMLLGSRTGSSQLREWATLELKGYPVPAKVPDYRVIAAGLHLDAVTGRAVIKGQPISSRSLPDFVAEHVSERLPLTQAVDELEALAARFEDSGEYLKLAPPMTAEIASYMNYQIGNPYQQIQAIYWSVHPSVIRGVLGQVRTVLTEFVAELRAAVGESEELPSPGQTNDAFQVAVSGNFQNSPITIASGPTNHGETVNIKNKIADARGNLVIGSSNVVQNNTNGFDARALLDFAGLVGQIAPTLGLPAAEQAELQSAAAALHEAASESVPEKGRLRRLGDAVMQGLTKAAPTVASQMALAAGQDAIHMLGH
jgi:AbiTii